MIVAAFAAAAVAAMTRALAAGSLGDDVDVEEDDDDVDDNGDGVVDRGGGLHLCSWLMVEYGRKQDGHIQAFRFGDGVARWLALWC